MHEDLSNSIEAWEDEGGAVLAVSDISDMSMTGTAAQVEWAGRIKDQVNNEFDRVSRLFRSIADGQNDDKRSETEAIIAILEDKRADVMGRGEAGYFIHDWQQIGDQVKLLIRQDSRYQAIKSRKAPRHDQAQRLAT